MDLNSKKLSGTSRKKTIKHVGKITIMKFGKGLIKRMNL